MHHEIRGSYQDLGKGPERQYQNIEQLCQTTFLGGLLHKTTTLCVTAIAQLWLCTSSNWEGRGWLVRLSLASQTTETVRGTENSNNIADNGSGSLVCYLLYFLPATIIAQGQESRV